MLSYLSLFPDMLEDHFQDLTDEEVGILVRAAMRYAFDGVVPEFPARSVLGLTWRRLREHVDKCGAAASKMSELGKRSAAARGNDRSQTSSVTADAVPPSPKGKASADERAATAVDARSQDEPTSGNDRCTHTQSHTQSQSQSQSQTQVQNVSADADTVRARVKPSSKFVPPTIHEVIAYCQERGGKVNPQQWYAYYSANGWRVGRNPMRDWRAAVRTWENNGVNAPARAAPADYQRRSISPQGFSAMEVDLDAEVGT